MTTSDFEFDMEDFDPEKAAGFSSPAPGRYHGEVNAFQEHEPKSGKMTFDFEVLAGTTPNQEGRTIRLFLDRSIDSTWSDERKQAVKSKQFSLAVALGLARVEEAKAAKEARRRYSWDWSLAVGRQLCFDVEANEKTKTGTSVKDFSWVAVDSPKAAGIPLNEGKLAKQGDAAADPFGDVF
jgi:hypothetical protein